MEGSEFLKPGAVASDGNDPGTAPRQQHGHASADAAAGAGDDGEPIIEIARNGHARFTSFAVPP
jgi:hypothetical protein